MPTDPTPEQADERRREMPLGYYVIDEMADMTAEHWQILRARLKKRENRLICAKCGQYLAITQISDGATGGFFIEVACETCGTALKCRVPTYSINSFSGERVPLTTKGQQERARFLVFRLADVLNSPQTRERGQA